MGFGFLSSVMDPKVAENYLRYCCSVFGFDIGELWTANISQQKPLLQFKQLYKSPEYLDSHNLLIHPNKSSSVDEKDEEIHRFSPIMVRGVCDGGHIVWANTIISLGLIGRKELPLNTAVGIPVCSVGDDLYVMIVFSVKLIQMTPAAVEFLCSLAKAISNKSVPQMFKPINVSTPISAANTEQFVGIWDIMDLINQYSDVSFSVLTMRGINSFLDYQEFLVFKDFAQESMQESNNSRSSSSSRAIPDINQPSPQNRSRSESDLSTSSISWLNTLGKSTAPSKNSQTQDNAFVDEVSVASKHYNHFFEAKSGNRAFLLDVRQSVQLGATKFEEFLTSILSISNFSAAEIWLLADNDEDLFVFHSVSEESAKAWTDETKNIRFKIGCDVPGIVIESSRPYWDCQYNEHHEELFLFPRTPRAVDLQIKTAFGIPMPGSNSSSGAIVFYSTECIDVNLSFVDFVCKSAFILSANSIEPIFLSTFDIESIIYNPLTTLSEWLQNDNDPSNANSSPSDGYSSTIAGQSFLDKSEPSPSMKINLRGVLAATAFASNNFLSDTTNLKSKFRAASRKPNDEYCTDADPALSAHITASKSSYSRRCQHENCTRCAQGSTLYCISHGGGRRCTFLHCTKGARDRFFCSKHGGGKRCTTIGCSKSAVGGSSSCTQHGGGNRCKFNGCQKSSQSSTNFCVRHGGGVLCRVPNCARVSRGKSPYCASHSNSDKMPPPFEDEEIFEEPVPTENTRSKRSRRY